MSRSMRFIAAAAAMILAAAAAAVPANAQDWRSISSVRRFADEETLHIELEYGAGELRITPAESGVLYRARIRYNAENFEPRLSYDNGRLDIGLEGTNKGLNFDFKGDGAQLALALGSEAALDLDLAFGAVEANIELGGLRLRELNLATGASETRITISRPNPLRASEVSFHIGAADFIARGLGNIHADRIRLEGGVGDITLDFTGLWRGDTDLDVDLGVGSLTLRLPRHVGVRVTRDGFLTSFDDDGFRERNGVYFSENWETAEYQLTIDIDTALSDINVQWVSTRSASL